MDAQATWDNYWVGCMVSIHYNQSLGGKLLSAGTFFMDAD
jgi:hypothetical protein